MKKLKIIDRKISELNPAEYNPRTISEGQRAHLRASLRRFGAVDPAIINTHPDRKDIIVGGHRRLEVAEALGWETYPCVEVSLDLKAERELNIRLNKNTGDWDYELLGEFFEHDELLGFGFTDDELEPVVFANDGFIDNSEDDFSPRPIDETETEIVDGDIIEIGEHRLICGDATDAAIVEKVLDGATPQLLITDPPYGIEYDPEWRGDKLSNKAGLAIRKVANDDRADWRDAWRLAPSKIAYVWHGGLHACEVSESLIASNFEIRAQIIWVKNSLVISRGAYHWKHEPCYYAVRKGETASWIGDRSQTTTWEIEKQLKSETGHSTQKPVECMRRPMLNHAGDVYDPFVGSGTSIVAAHKLGRRCYAIEISPEECQLVVERMVRLDGSLQVKLNGEEWPHDEIFTAPADNVDN